MVLLSSADFFSKLPFLIHSFRNTIRVSDGFDPVQNQRFVGPDLGQNCLKKIQKTIKLPQLMVIRTLIMLNILCATLFPNFILLHCNLHHFSFKLVFSVTVENSVGLGQMASSETI